MENVTEELVSRDHMCVNLELSGLNVEINIIEIKILRQICGF